MYIGMAYGMKGIIPRHSFWTIKKMIFYTYEKLRRVDILSKKY
jgi:hypothetical protein